MPARDSTVPPSCIHKQTLPCGCCRCAGLICEAHRAPRPRLEPRPRLGTWSAAPARATDEELPELIRKIDTARAKALGAATAVVRLLDEDRHVMDPRTTTAITQLRSALRDVDELEAQI